MTELREQHFAFPDGGRLTVREVERDPKLGLGGWTIVPLPGGVRLSHACGQYRSFHESEWVGLMMETMTGHQCPTRAQQLDDERAIASWDLDPPF